MIVMKLVGFAAVAIITVALLITNTSRWAHLFREYMVDQERKQFGEGGSWERPWTRILSKIMVIFFGCMFIVFTYVLIFGGYGQE